MASHLDNHPGEGVPGAAAPAAGSAPPAGPPVADTGPFANPAANARLARMTVMFSLGLTVLATALIYWRWVNVTEPSSYIIIEGNEGHEGAVVVVRSADHPEAMATLSRENNYAATIFLHPGTYTLTATHNGETLINGELLMVHRRMKVLRLRGGKPAVAAPPPRREGLSQGMG